MSDDRGMPSVHGAVLGMALADLADRQEARFPEIERRCATCAFRKGTVPNMMASTVLEAMRCVTRIDPAPFGCHSGLKMGEKPAKLCTGYLLCTAAPWEEVKATVKQVAQKTNPATLSFQEVEIRVVADFEAWRQLNDPDDKMDAYELARMYEISRSRKTA